MGIFCNVANLLGQRAVGITLILIVLTLLSSAVFAAPPNAVLETYFDSLPANSYLNGNAYISSDKVLHLTDAAGGQQGRFFFTPNGQVLRALRMKCMAFIGGGNNADGLSFSYGNITDESFTGEWGSGNGLIVRFRTYSSNVLEVVYGGTQIASVGIANGTIRANTWVPFEVNVNANGALVVKYNNVTYVNMVVFGWNPQSTWRFGFGARTGGQNDNHWIDNLSIRDSQPYPISITRLDPTPVGPPTSSVRYGVLFSEAVQAVEDGHFSLTQVSGTPTAAVSVFGTPAFTPISENFTSGAGVGTPLGNAYVSGGSLHLTDAVNSQLGTWTCNPGQALRVFQATFRLFIGGGTGADGVAFAYGANAGGSFSNEGPAGNGLVVSFDTYDNGGEGTPNITVRCNGADLQVVSKTLRTNSWVQVSISVSPDGRCTVYHDGTKTHDQVMLPDWNPQSSWRMGLGAGTGGSNDNQWFDDLAVTVQATPTINVSESFTSGPGVGSLLGSAAVTGSMLRLTNNVNGQTGTWTYNPGEAVPAFRAMFLLYIGGGGGADGFSFAYGANAGGIFGHEGPGGNGLVVSFDTYENGGEGTPNITVRYNGTDLQVVPQTLRTSSWVPVIINVTASGLCTVYHNGTRTHSDVILPGWNPQAAWRMGLGAQTGGANDIHAVDNLSIQNSKYVTTLNSLGGAGDIRLNLNSAAIQDFEGAALDPSSFTTGEIYTFDFVGPTVSSVVHQTLPFPLTNVTPLVWRVTFSEAVAGVTTTAFNLSPNAPGATIASVSQVSTSVYDVSVDVPSGSSGALRLNVNNNPSGVTDLLGNPATGSGTGDAYEVDGVAPTFSSVVATPDPVVVGNGVTVTFTASETLGANPQVSVNGHAAAFVSKSGNNYTYAYTTVPVSDPVGVASLSISGTDLANNLGSGGGSFTLSKATPAVSTWPSGAAITYGQPLSDSILTGGEASVAGVFTWTNPGTAPNAGAGQSFAVTFTPTDTSNYNPVSGSSLVSVDKAAPAVTTWPAASAIAYGQTLASSTLSGGSAAVPGSFAWTNPTLAPNAGTWNETVRFTPTDTANYGPVFEGVDVLVNKAAPTVTWPTAGAIAYGQMLSNSALTGGSSSTPGSFDWDDPSTKPNAGPNQPFPMTFTPTDTSNFNPLGGNVNITVNKKTLTAAIVNNPTKRVDGNTTATLAPGNFDLVGLAGDDAFTVTQTVGAYDNAAAGSRTVTATLNAGHFTPQGSTLAGNYNLPTSASGPGTITAKLVPSVTAWPAASGITYPSPLSGSTLTGGTASTPGSFAWTLLSRVPNVGLQSESVTFTPTDSANYTTVSGDVPITVGKGTPSVTTWPTGSTINHLQTLASSTLSGGVTTPAGGSFDWDAPNTTPSAGTSAYPVTYTPADVDNYNTVAGFATLTVNRATPTVNVWPSASNIIYGQTLASSTLSGGGATVNGTFAFTYPDTAPNAGAGQAFPVTFTPADSANYTTASGSSLVSVDKAAPAVNTWPTASAITYGQTLANSTLSGGEASVPGSFAWTVPGTAPTAGIASHSVTFTPADTSNYTTTAGQVSITVNPATPTVNAWPTAQTITYGQTLADSTLSGGEASVPGAFVWTAPSTTPNAGTPQHSVTFQPADSGSYTTTTGTVSVTVNPATPTVNTWPAASAITYGQTLADSTLTGGAASVPGYFAFTTPSTAPNGGTADQAVTFTPTDTHNYTTTAGTVSVTVNPATPAITTPPTASTITYGQTLADSTLTGGAASVPGSFVWTTPSTTPNAGTAPYSATFLPTNSANYGPTQVGVNVTVRKATPAVTAPPTASTITYGQTLADSVLTDGAASTSGVFAWVIPGTTPNVGTASYPVLFRPDDTGNYATVTNDVSVTVEPKPLTAIVVNKPTKSFDGNTTAALTPGNYAIVGLVGADAITITKTAGAYADSALGIWLITVTLAPVDFAPAGGTLLSNYQLPTQATGNGEITDKVIPTITAWPAASAITYGQALSDSTLTGGSASAPGTFAWTTPTTTPNAGARNESVTFTPDDTATYVTLQGNVSLTVSKVTPTITTPPTASDIAYGQTLAHSALAGGAASVPGSFAWTTPTTAPLPGLAPYPVTFTPTDTANYNTVEFDVNLTVFKATPTVNSWPAASDIEYGQALSDSTLSGGIASVAGTFAFTTPATTPPAGAWLQSVTFTPTDEDHYNTVTGNVAVTVTRVAPQITTPPTASDITYGQTLASSALSGGAASVTGSFAWTTPSTAPNAGAALQPVTFTPADLTNYKPVVFSVSLTVNKATPTVNAWPTVSAPLSYGDPLSLLTLSGGSASVPGAFHWIDPASVPDLGTADQPVTFMPADSANYESVAGVASVTVTKAAPTITTQPTASDITQGQALFASTLNGGVASVPGNFAFTTPGTVPPLGTNPQSVTFTPDDSTHYNAVAFNVNVTVNNKVTPTITTPPAASAITYGQALSASTLTGGEASVPGMFSWSTPGEIPNAGTADQPVTFTPNDTVQYNSAGCLASVTVSKATPGIVTPPTASEIQAGQTLAASTLTGGVATVPGVFAWTAPGTIPSVGTTSQSVTFTPSEADNYNTVTLSVSVTARVPLSVTLSPSTATVPLGQPFTFTSSATGGTGAIHYEWFKDGLPAPHGTDSSEYVLSAVTQADAGVYRVDASDDREVVSSNEATLEVATGVPVMCAMGLSVLAGAFAVSGAFAARRKQ